MEKIMKDVFWSTIDAAKKEEDMQNATISSPVGAGKDDNNVVESTNNTIYFYSEVTRPKILQLNKTINTIGINLVNQANILRNPEAAKLYIHINSFGGSVFAGFSAVDYVKSCPAHVETIVEGCAASAATLISTAGHHRKIRRNSYMLIHQLSSGMWGKYEEMKDALENSDLFMKMIKEHYHEHTRIPKRKLNEMLKRDLWFDAETCLEYGLVDEIIE
jgi:ATP-dependent Clp endopeptidase proteolytic subunit ClpP